MLYTYIHTHTYMLYKHMYILTYITDIYVIMKNINNLLISKVIKCLVCVCSTKSEVIM